MTYSQTVKERAVRIYGEDGGPEAERVTGVPRRTIRRWVKVMSPASADPTAKAAAVRERVVTQWADYRTRESVAAGAQAAHLRQAVRQSVESDDATAAKQYAIAYGIMIDKADQLSDSATATVEAWASSTLDVSLQGLVGRMEQVIHTGVRETNP